MRTLPWLENNHMKINESKRHFLASRSPEHLRIKVEYERVWESQAEKLFLYDG